MITHEFNENEWQEMKSRNIGKRIRSAFLHIDSRHPRLDTDKIFLKFDDETELILWDGGQCCCEVRYITTDDSLETLEGAVLARIEIKQGPDKEELGDIHEIQFLEIGTDKGFVTFATHNEHNGYYGGFSIYAEEVKNDKS